MLPQIPRHMISSVRNTLLTKYRINVTTQELVYANWKHSKQAYHIKRKENKERNYISKIPYYYFTNEII